MILTCPSCSARYLIAGDAIGEQGRYVRCGKCGHSWTQEPVHDSIDELSRTHPQEKQPPAPGSVEAAVESFLNDTIPEGVKPIPESAAPDQPIKPVFKRPPAPPKEPGVISKNLRTITAVAVAAAIFFVLAAAMVMARAPIIEALPFTRPVFVALGFEEKGDGRTLVFDSVTAKIEGPSLIVTGSLINLSSQTMMLPPLAVDMLDSSGKLIKTVPGAIEQPELAGEQSLELNLTFDDVPAEAAQARLRFRTDDDEESAEESHEEEDSATTAGEGADNTHAQPEGESGHSTAHE